MIHILIDNASYPEATVLGVYRTFNLAMEKYDELYDDSDPYGPGLEVISWDIVNNRRVDFGSDDDGGTAMLEAVA